MRRLSQIVVAFVFGACAIGKVLNPETSVSVVGEVFGIKAVAAHFIVLGLSSLPAAEETEIPSEQRRLESCIDCAEEIRAHLGAGRHDSARSMPSKPGKSRSPAASTRGKTVSLDVLNGAKPTIRASKNSRRRAAVLIGIQILILVHIGLWLLGREFGWFGGKTLTPVEPSEAMQTIEIGAINAGFVFFALALLSTVIFGRWVCGWACHIVMLQDFCGWIMKKLGVRPKPFRSRTLIWVPLVVAMYMFVWPTFKRLALFPLLENVWPGGLRFFMPVAEWRGFSNHLLTEQFWQNPETGTQFPVIMALPTLLVVGFAAVYFLGSKGFCTYGCPYGGFFAPLDEFAPGRIRVDEEKCEQTGHCTVACSSNVRVHEEVNTYGMVVDPGCMKCLDCVSVCPNDALSFGFGKPATMKSEATTRASHPKAKTNASPKPKKQYDLSLREDIALVGVFVLTLLSIRGLYLYEGVPFLMSVGFAGVVSFLAFKVWRLFSGRHELVRVQNLKLKWRGRIRPAGWAFAGVLGVIALLTLQNGFVNYNQWRATVLEKSMPSVDFNQAFSPSNADAVTDEARAHAARVLSYRTRALGISDGGYALMTSPAVLEAMIPLYIVQGDFEEASRWQARAIEMLGEGDRICLYLFQLKLLTGDRADAMGYASDVLKRHPEYRHLRATYEAVRQTLAPPSG